MRYLILPMLLISLSLFAQKHEIDSLIKILDKTQGNSNVDSLLALSQQYEYVDRKIAWDYAEKATELAKKLNYQEGKIRSSYAKGVISMLQSNRQEALTYFENGLILSESAEFELLTASGLFHISHYHQRENDYPTSFDYLKKSLTIYTKLNDKRQMSYCFTAFGDLYKALADYEQSLTYYFKSLKIKEALNNRRGISILTSNIGSIYLAMGKFNDALKHFERSLIIDIKSKDLEGMVYSYKNVGAAHQKLAQFDSAYDYFNRGLIKSRELGSRFNEASLLDNLGSTLRSQNRYQESLKHLFAALEINLDIKEIKSAANTYNNISETYLAMDRPLEAKKYALQAIAISRDIDINQYRVGYDLLAQSAQLLGDLSNAYDYLQKANSIKDSIFTLEATAKMDELQVQYETKKKEEEILLLTQQRQAAKFKRNTFYAIGILTSFLLLLLFNQQRLKTKKNKQLLQKEQEVERMKSQFFANISHEFRTPLTLILGPIETMQSETDDPNVNYNLDVMKQNANQLLKLINQLLDLSKLEAGKFKLEVANEDVVPIIKGVTMAFHSMAELKEIDLQIVTDTDHLRVYFDRVKLETILVNLLSNAFKFTPEKGEIKVTFSANDASDNGQYYTLGVSDNGNGIPEADIAHVFNRFYQSNKAKEKNYEGTGIGLALTKELVELHKGTIEVVSEVGVGTEFIIRLPLGKQHFKEEEIVSISESRNDEYKAPMDFAAGMNIPDSTIEADRTKPILLLVEDNEDVMRYLKDIFQEEYTVLKALDGEQGILMAQEQIPDLIISDVMMPKKDGYEVCKTLKQDEKTSHIPVILLTAKASLENKIEGLETNADDYVTKPFVPTELLLRVKNLIGSRKKLWEKYKRELELRPSDIAVNSVDEAFLEKIIKEVEENIGNEQFGVEQLGLAIGMSRSQLHRKLKALLDQAPNQFIRSFRLKRAHDLLKQNSATASEIAYQVGFGSPSYFTKCFREQYGYTPSEIHKMHPGFPS